MPEVSVRAVTLEVHNPAAFENAFRCRTVTLTPVPLFSSTTSEAGGRRSLRRLSRHRRCQARRALARDARGGTRPAGATAFADKHRSAGVVSDDLFVGHLAGRTALFVDDLISTGGTRLRAARAAGKAGARRVLALVTHGLLMPRGAAVLGDAAAERLVVTDSVPAFRLGNDAARGKLEILPTAPLLAETIARLHDGRALTGLVVF
jgi:ribose-phosphate pyrophosphokinase